MSIIITLFVFFCIILFKKVYKNVTIFILVKEMTLDGRISDENSNVEY